MSSLTKVHNVTNVSTPELVAFRLTNRSVAVNGKLLHPGESVEMATEDWLAQAATHRHMLSKKALVAEAVADVPKEHLHRDAKKMKGVKIPPLAAPPAPSSEVVEEKK